MKKNALTMLEVRSNRIGLNIGFLFQEVVMMQFTRRSFRKVGVPLLIGVWTAVILSLAGCGRTPPDDGSQTVPIAGGGGGGAAPIVTPTGPIPYDNASLNSSVTAEFSIPIDPTSIADNTFYLQTVGGTAHIPGTLSYANNTATFTPSSPLSPGTSYLATVTGVRSLGGVSMAGDKKWIFSTTSSTTSAGPTIVNMSLILMDNNTIVNWDGKVNKDNVSITTPITFTFSEDINPSTLVAGTTVKLQTTGGGTSVDGTVSYSGVTGKFTPIGALAPETTYLFTLTTGVLSRFGVPLAQNFTMMFTTGAAAGPVAPRIDSTSPAAGDNNVLWDNTITPIIITFSQDIDPFTLVAGTTIYLQTADGVPVPGSVSYTQPKATFTPNAFLAPETSYILTVTTGVTNRSGVPMSQKFTLVFTTIAGTGSALLRIIDNSITPSANSTLVPKLNPNITFTFNQNVDPSTLGAGTVTLVAAGPTFVSGTVTLNGKTATFTPSSLPLAGNTTYMVTVTTGVKNLSGVGMAQEYKWLFTTEP